jgi:hypothetical protein
MRLIEIDLNRVTAAFELTAADGNDVAARHLTVSSNVPITAFDQNNVTVPRSCNDKTDKNEITCQRTDAVLFLLFKVNFDMIPSCLHYIQKASYVSEMTSVIIVSQTMVCQHLNKVA